MSLFSMWASHLISYHSKQKIAELLSSIPTWETLRTLGQSRVLALTALVPFIGSIILFNSNIVHLLQISPDLIKDWMGLSDNAAKQQSYSFSLNRLQILYFGLTFIGVASGLFKLLCPTDIKKYTSISYYIEGEKDLITAARRSILVTQVASDYLENHGDQHATGPKYLRDAAYPVQSRIFFHNVFEEIAEEALIEDEPQGASGESQNETSSIPGEEQFFPDPDPFGVRVGPRSVIDSEKVAALIYRQISIERGFWLNFFSSAESHLTDLLALRYSALVHSRPTLRLVITVLYTMGFATLLAPTVATFWRVTLRAVGF
ncbi:hypothetical protein [Methylobacterium sp. WL19]|uniref:hypothetical protein n=1 Tax=Methylobacterium sp. WL19 TaxID=2603896 RepID=UPI0011C9874E|nr:hypothetical protein [Methylobacterium sp. WL19]TXN27393.1 hypothetical protein FV220_11565 [Methylobacterium sp. WL19]